jgi:hypothetical protein
MENRYQKSKSNAEMNQCMRRVTIGMQFRPRIPGQQTIVQRSTNRFYAPTCSRPMGSRMSAPQYQKQPFRRPYNQMSCCPSSRIRPNNSWIRGIPVPPKPPKHIRQTPFPSMVRTPGTLPHTGPRYQPEIEKYYGQRQRSSGFGSKSSFDQNKRYKIVRPTKYGSQFVSGFGYQNSVRSGMGKRSMSEPDLDYLFAEPTRYRNSPLKRSPSGGQLSRGFHRFSPQSRSF